MPDGGQQLYVSSSRGNRREDRYSILNMIQEHPILSRVFDSMLHYTEQDAIVLRFLMLYSRYCPRVSRIHHSTPTILLLDLPSIIQPFLQPLALHDLGLRTIQHRRHISRAALSNSNPDLLGT